MTFHIGSQQGGVINNVQGDQIIHGGQTTIGSPPEALVVLQRVRQEIEGTGISGRSKTAADKELDSIERQLHRREPDKPTIGASLARLTKVLASAGTLMTGGTTLLNGITALATWLGTFGARALDLIRSGG
jgi:hypothetical protein